MNGENKNEIDAKQLLEYFGIAARFRHQEFNIQMLRNTVFTGFQAFFLIAYGSTIKDVVIASVVIAVFGIAFSILWIQYYEGSIYWSRYWEIRTKEINDLLLSKVISNANLFQDHPAGSDQQMPPPIKFGGQRIKHKDVHKILKTTQWVFLGMWIVLTTVAAVKLWGQNNVQLSTSTKDKTIQYPTDSSKPVSSIANSIKIDSAIDNQSKK